MFKRMNVIFLISLGLLLCSTTKAQTGNQGDPPPAMPGLKITRTELLKKFVEYGIPYTFTKTTNENNLPCFIASDTKRLLIKVVGKEDDLRLAEFTLTLTSDTAFNHSSMKKITWFLFAFGYKQRMDWFFNMVKARNANPEIPLLVSKKFNYGREIKYEYFPSQQQIKISVISY